MPSLLAHPHKGNSSFCVNPCHTFRITLDTLRRGDLDGVQFNFRCSLALENLLQRVLIKSCISNHPLVEVGVNNVKNRYDNQANFTSEICGFYQALSMLVRRRVSSTHLGYGG